MKKMTPLTLAAWAAALTLVSLPGYAQTASAAHPMKPGMTMSAPGKSDKGDAVEKSNPDQASVAAKTTFGSVPAATVAKAKALDAHDLAPAAKLVGKSGSFQGVVAKVYKPGNNGVVILDFDEEYKTALTATVRPEYYAKFPDLDTLSGKHVFVTGTFSDYKGRAEIEMSSPSQVKVIK